MVESPDAYEWSSYQFYIGKKKPPEWIYRDFILGYFGEKVSIAQKGYRDFVNKMVKADYDNPLDEVVSSTLLGGPDFIAFVKDKIISNRIPDKDLPNI